ncbi:MAG: hypothetical protein K0R52_1454, partial [Alphaproteobacteria bacterium]|nr:hypothetical protein [Alphaproteobacteria bacterium]
MDWQEQLISVYLVVCKEYQQRLCGSITRLSNYCPMIFPDEEVITIYLFGVMSGRYRVKDIYNYTARHLRGWSPNLPSYEGYDYRLNKISHLFEGLVDSLLSKIPMDTAHDLPALIDSMPIILAHRGRRFKACVAQEIATPNGYCATKKLHYYGVKLHMVGCYRKGSLPLPVNLGITDAGTADVKVLDQIEKVLPEGLRLFADKAYQKENQPIVQKERVTLYT